MLTNYFALYLYQILEKYFKVILKMSKNWNFKETGPSYDQQYVWSDNHGQNILKKVNNLVKLDKARKVWYPLLQVFDCYC